MKDNLSDNEADGWLLLGGEGQPPELSSHGSSNPLNGGTLSFHAPVKAATARAGIGGGGGGGGGGGPVMRRSLR